MRRRGGLSIVAWAVLFVTFMCGVGAIGFSIWAAFASERARADDAQRQRASDRRLQNCVVALLLIPPDQRVRLSPAEVERLCPPVEEFVVPPTTTSTSVPTTTTTTRRATTTSSAAGARAARPPRRQRPSTTPTTTRPTPTTTSQPCVTRLNDWCVIAGPPPGGG